MTGSATRSLRWNGGRPWRIFNNTCSRASPRASPIRTSVWTRIRPSNAGAGGRPLAFVDRPPRDRAASEDVVEETFVGFVTSLPNFDDRRELQTYLFTIASHKLTDFLRRKGRHPLHTVSDSAGDLLLEQLDSI